MKEVICPYHPLFSKFPDISILGSSNPELFNVEMLVEQTMAHIGSYEFINAAHADFSDESDCKTASICLTPSREGQNTYRGRIDRVTSAGGESKRGALRCIVYNPHSHSLKYYFLPKEKWIQHVALHPTSKIGSIRFSYNIKNDTIVKFDGYECNSFHELATRIQ